MSTFGWSSYSVYGIRNRRNKFLGAHGNRARISSPHHHLSAGVDVPLYRDSILRTNDSIYLFLRRTSPATIQERVNEQATKKQRTEGDQI